MKKILISSLIVITFASLIYFSGIAGNSSVLKHADAVSHASEKLPVFDTHVHYSQPAWEVYPPAAIIQLLKRSGVVKALVSSSPDDGTRMLYEEDPESIVPFLRPYHADVNSGNWYLKDRILSYFLERLETPIYKGIGEFHIHEPFDADSPIIKKTVQLAVERDLFIHVHSDHTAIETIFSFEPSVKILWAHAGMSDPPGVVSDMLDRYENLWVDISIREYEIAPGGILDSQWESLFLDHPDRITIGSDTWVTSQWDNYESIIDFDRKWLDQLPPEVARQIAYGNAKRLFDS
jgi:hypothetical protein